MDALDKLRNAIKSHFPESSELQLSGHFANHRRFNFYFKIAPGQRFLLYLNWDGDGDRFTLKCLEFTDIALLDRLMASYYDIGLKAFNIGQPRTMLYFIYLPDDRLKILDMKGTMRIELPSNEISCDQLLDCVSPL